MPRWGALLLLLAKGLSATGLCAWLKSSPRQGTYPRSNSLSAHTSLGRIQPLSREPGAEALEGTGKGLGLGAIILSSSKPRMCRLSLGPVTRGTALGSELPCRAAGPPKSPWTASTECPATLHRVSLWGWGWGRFLSRSGPGLPFRVPSGAAPMAGVKQGTTS